jgi:hypothetical protein
MPSVPPKTGTGAQNMKTGPDTVGTAENGAGSAKHEKQKPTPSVQPKTGPGAQNMKTEPDARSTAETESGSAKHENGTRRR